MKFNQEEFDRLPVLLTRGVVREWTGLSKSEITKAARDGELRTYPAWKDRNGGHVRYFKADVARVCGMKA